MGGGKADDPMYGQSQPTRWFPLKENRILPPKCAGWLRQRDVSSEKARGPHRLFGVGPAGLCLDEREELIIDPVLEGCADAVWGALIDHELRVLDDLRGH
jgi:hypothetical protein